MKKNMLKYCLILLVTIFSCTEAMSQINAFDCYGNWSNMDLFCPAGDIPSGYERANDKTYYLIGEDLYTCMLADDNTVGGADVFWMIKLPLGNGVFILMLSVLGYGGVLYYRRRRECEGSIG